MQKRSSIEKSTVELHEQRKYQLHIQMSLLHAEEVKAQKVKVKNLNRQKSRSG